MTDIPYSEFAENGFVIIRRVVPENLRSEISEQIQNALTPLVGPVEYEVDVGYPGAPTDRSAPGGQTPRRLLHAFARHECFAALSQLEEVARWIKALLVDAQAESNIVMSQCHHNCVMTKYPGFSSATAWHQDIRYWSFDNPALISAWFALGVENKTNGALKVIPGSHKFPFDRGRLDRDLFLRTELAENKALIRTAESVELEAGDVLLFSSQLFHAAGKNLSETVKLTPVFTYHAEANQPIPGTRSAQLPGIVIDCVERPRDSELSQASDLHE